MKTASIRLEALNGSVGLTLVEDDDAVTLHMSNLQAVALAAELIALASREREIVH